MVSHDRQLLDNVVTGTLVFEGDGLVRDYVGGYEDWQRQRASAVASATVAPAQAKALKPEIAETRRAVAKLSYKETRELTELPARIEILEREQQDLHARLADPALYQGDGAAVGAVKSRLAELEIALAAAYARWEDLEGRR